MTGPDNDSCNANNRLTWGQPSVLRSAAPRRFCYVVQYPCIHSLDGYHATAGWPPRQPSDLTLTASTSNLSITLGWYYSESSQPLFYKNMTFDIRYSLWLARKHSVIPSTKGRRQTFHQSGDLACRVVTRLGMLCIISPKNSYPLPPKHPVRLRWWLLLLPRSLLQLCRRNSGRKTYQRVSFPSTFTSIVENDSTKFGLVSAAILLSEFT